MTEVRLFRPPTLHRRVTVRVAPGSQLSAAHASQAVVPIHEKVLAVYDVASYLEEAAYEYTEVQRQVWGAPLRAGRDGGPARSHWVSPGQQYGQFMMNVHAMFVLSVLQQRCYLPGWEMLSAADARHQQQQVVTMARNLWGRVNHHRLMLINPLAVTHPRLFESLNDQGEALAHFLDGDSVTVMWPSVPPRSRQRSLSELARQVVQHGGVIPRASHREDVALAHAVREMMSSHARHPQKLEALKALARALTRASEAMQRSPRAAMMAATAHDALSDDSHDTPLRRCIEELVNREEPAHEGVDTEEALREAAEEAHEGFELALSLLKADAAHTLVHLANSPGDRATQMDHLVRYFGEVTHLPDTAKTTIQEAFSRVAREAATGHRASLTEHEVHEIGEVIGSHFRGRSLYHGASLVLNLMQLGQALQGPDANATTGQRLDYWGSMVSSGVAIGRGLRLLGPAVGSARMAQVSSLLAQTRVLRELTSETGVTLIGGISAMFHGVVEIEEGVDESDDVEIAIGGINVLAAGLQMLAIAFPALEPVALLVGMTAGVVEHAHEEIEAAQPFNLRLFKSFAATATGLRGGGEAESIAHYAGVEHELNVLANSVAGEAPTAFWRPLCTDVRSAIEPGTLSGVMRGGHYVMGLAEYAHAALARVLGAAPAVRRHRRDPKEDLIRRVLYGSHAANPNVAAAGVSDVPFAQQLGRNAQGDTP